MKKVALLVGVEKYRDQLIAPLQFATADVLALEDSLQTVCGFQNVMVLADSLGYEAPDFFNINHAFDQAVTQLEPDDLFLFYFAGHGIENDGRGYLMTRETSLARPYSNSLSKDVLEDTLQHVRARRRILLFDTCRNSPELARGGVDNLMADCFSRDIVAIAEVGAASTTTTALLSACGKGERAFEWPDWGHGVFTYFLLQGLHAEAWTEEHLDFKQLASFTIRQVQDWTRTAPGIQKHQTPWYQEFGAAESIVLANKGAEVPSDLDTQKRTGYSPGIHAIASTYEILRREARQALAEARSRNADLVMQLEAARTDLMTAEADKKDLAAELEKTKAAGKAERPLTNHRVCISNNTEYDITIYTLFAIMYERGLRAVACNDDWCEDPPSFFDQRWDIAPWGTCELFIEGEGDESEPYWDGCAVAVYIEYTIDGCHFNDFRTGSGLSQWTLNYKSEDEEDSDDEDSDDEEDDEDDNDGDENSEDEKSDEEQ